MQTIELTQNNIYQGNLILVNDKHQLKMDYEKELVEYKGQIMHRDVSKMLDYAFCKLQVESQIKIISGYRCFNEQKELYETSLKENGWEYTKKYVAYPRCSEHETGLAIDLALLQDKIDFICPSFPYEGICQQFRDICHQYGFIERYKKDKQDLTHIDQEPWHFRYVGFPHSQIIEDKKLCLEEYHQFIKKYSIYQPLQFVHRQQLIEIFYVPVTNDHTTICIKDDALYQISGNNKDGVIVTLWRTCL